MVKASPWMAKASSRMVWSQQVGGLETERRLTGVSASMRDNSCGTTYPHDVQVHVEQKERKLGAREANVREQERPCVARLQHKPHSVPSPLCVDQHSTVQCAYGTQSLQRRHRRQARA